VKLSSEGKLRLAVQLAFVAGVGTATDVAYAQSAPASGNATQLTGVQILGSRIKQPNLTSSSSMTVLSDKELELQGTVNVETLLNNTPQVFAGFSSNDSNGATGTATVDLRGLGPQRTLVLIDGKRLNAGDARQSPPSPDINFIPAALVDHVEILSGGASAVYGSDAIAGVVNFVMKKDFQGFRVDSQYNRTDHSDGTTGETTLVWGSNFASGKGNVTLYAGYTKMDAITQDARGYSACSLKTPASGTTHTCAGSAVIPQGYFIDYARYYAGKPYAAFGTPSGTISGINPGPFNFAPYNYLQRPSSRYHLGGFAHDKINEHFDVYGSAMFMDNHTVAQIAPSGLFGQLFQTGCSNP
jgi:iron complex outermembrane receptor protein